MHDRLVSQNQNNDGQHSSDSGLVAEFCASFTNSLKSQANGAIQLANHFGLNASEFSLSQMSGAEFGTSRWAAQVGGQIAATALEFGGLRLALRGLAGVGGANLAPAAEATGSGVLRRTTVSALSGALMGGVLTPEDPNDPLGSRLKHASIDAATFATVGLVSSGLSVASTQINRPLLADVIRNGYANNAIGGFTGGVVNAELNSVSSGNGLTPIDQAARRGAEYALVGMGAHGLESAAGAVGRATFSNPYRPDANGFIDFSGLPQPKWRVQRSLQHEQETPSVWYESVPAANRFPTLQGKVDADVVIVGGGITGLHIARELSNHGHSTVLLEGKQIASGTTSQMAAQIERMPDWGFAKLKELYPDRFPQIMGELNGAAERISEIAQHSNSDYRSVTTYKLTNRRNLAAVQEEVEAAQPYDNGARMISGDQAAQIYPGQTIVGALAHEGQVNPRKLALAMANDGPFRVFENSPATGITVARDGQPVTLHTPEGTVTANKVIFATGGPPQMFEHLRGRVYTAQVFAGTGRYPGRPIESNFISDRDPIIDFWRDIAPNRVLFGGSGRPLALLWPLRENSAVASRMQQFIPGAQPEAGWSGTIFVTRKDGLPIIAQHPTHRSLYGVTGLGGSGLVNSGFVARMLRLELEGQPEQNLLSERRFGR